MKKQKYTYRIRISKQKIKCTNCKQEFLRHQCYIKKENFCSNKCSQQYQHRNSSTLVSCSWCGIPVKIHNYRREGLHFCSARCKGKWMSIHLQAEKAPNWKGGFYSTIANTLCNSRYRRIRQSVLALDNYKCQLCNSSERLEIHHIIEKGKNPALIYDITNMITLCKKCHCKIRSNEEDYIGLFDGIVAKRANSVEPKSERYGNTELTKMCRDYIPASKEII